MLDMRTKGVLLNIIKHCERIEDKSRGIDEAVFITNEDVKEIICFNLFQIGELAKKLDTDFINTYSKVPWNNIKGMRDRIVHGYGSINMNRVWATATTDITPLREYCEKIIDNN